MAKDLKQTVFLPKTDFPMRAGLPKKEPEIQAMWDEIGFFDKLREKRKGQEKFILHDGPPYANGNLHIGHALNKILKDLINRFQSSIGKDANYVPGWDCHGLPIEWKIEEQYRKKKLNKDEVPIVEFRNECRDFAAHWVNVQSEEFQRLGVMGNWADPYLTMAYSSEAVIAREIGKFLMNGSLFRGTKPVMWSAVEKQRLLKLKSNILIEHQQRFMCVFLLKRLHLKHLMGQRLLSGQQRLGQCLATARLLMVKISNMVFTK